MRRYLNRILSSTCTACTAAHLAEFGTRALWNKRMIEEPTPEDALVVARALRVEGDREAGNWRNGSRKPAVPLTKIQTDILQLLARRRAL